MTPDSVGQGGEQSRSADLRYESRVDDDDDWTGTPPEGRYTRDRAQPAFWRRQWQATAAWGGLLLAIVVLVIVVLVR
jgi:hypothetical protein